MLQTIDEEAFSDSSIEILYNRLFYDCKQLSKFEILINSELQTIDCEAFSQTGIESFKMPRQITEIKPRTMYRAQPNVNYLSTLLASFDILAGI